MLKVIAKAHPGLALAGLDMEERQIAFARELLGASRPDLRVGDALQLPWAANHFDHGFMMWFLEHVKDPLAALIEARRVLKPGGTLRAIETDYLSFRISPPDPDFSRLIEVFAGLFDQSGRASTGPLTAGWLENAGFSGVKSTAFRFSWGQAEGLPGRIEYVLGFMEPVLKGGGGDWAGLQGGIQAFRAAGKDPQGRLEVCVHRAEAVK